MKKTLFSFLVLLFACATTFAQNTPTTDPFEVQTRVYKAALKNYDLPAATVALYSMMAMKPERSDLKDSLAFLYFGSERYAQSYLVGEEIIKNNPKRTDILELVAVSKQNLGMIKEALADYEKLYAEQKSLFYLYQAATLQYQLKRYGECVASLDQIISNPQSDKDKVNIRLQTGSQEVPMKAAALNVKGICAVELNQEQAARDNFKKALEVFPEFALAKGNLEGLDKKQGEAAKPTPIDVSTPATTTEPKKKK